MVKRVLVKETMTVEELDDYREAFWAILDEEEESPKPKGKAIVLLYPRDLRSEPKPERHTAESCYHKAA